MDARKILLAFAAIALGLAAPSALAQTYPSKPVRFVVGFAAGGSTDVVARLVAQKLAERIGQPVIVENRPGADTIIAAETVAKAPPDGHTLLFMTFSTMTILPHARKRLPYDPFRDFVHVAHIAYAPFALVVNPAVPAGSVAELIALARSRPGQLTYAAGSEGGYITAEMFKAATGTDITHVPYKGSSPATTDLLAGQVNMMFSLFAGIVPYLKTQRLKPLAITGEKRSPALPDVPTMSEAGLAGFESSSSFGISAPRGTPPAVVKRLNSEVAAVLQMPDIVEKLLAQGVEPRSATPEQFTALLRSESEKYRAVLQRIGFKAE
jgi:tripartite-type tricarboxylate transporter receptor subunit TctC